MRLRGQAHRVLGVSASLSGSLEEEEDECELSGAVTKHGNTARLWPVDTHATQSAESLHRHRYVMIQFDVQ